MEMEWKQDVVSCAMMDVCVVEVAARLEGEEMENLLQEAVEIRAVWSWVAVDESGDGLVSGGNGVEWSSRSPDGGNGLCL